VTLSSTQRDALSDGRHYRDTHGSSLCDHLTPPHEEIWTREATLVGEDIQIILILFFHGKILTRTLRSLWIQGHHTWTCR